MTNEKYLLWHPDHRSYSLIRPSKKLIGMRFRFDECLEGKFRINLVWEITDCTPAERAVFRARLPYPVTLELDLTRCADGTKVRHLLQIGGTSWPTSVLDPAIERFAFTSERQEILKRHVQQEFKNLERLI
ncbi:MAG: hypothetical protein K2Y27_20200 [Xanthobacteraceae bacterium]|nr:hypothetical protein [Xanthobacteraceae bacterium]